MNDALNRRLCSITLLYALASAYEKKLDKMEKEIATQKRLRGTPTGLRIGGIARTPGTSNANKRPADAPTPTAADTPPPPKKKTGPAPKPRATEQETAAAAAANAKRNEQRRRKPVFDMMASAAAWLGGPQMFTRFFIMMLKSAVCATGTPKRNIHFDKTAIKLICDDEELSKKFIKELDKRRKPKMAQFRNAQFSGVSISAMDQMRFASIGTPGHSTMAAYQKQWEEALEQHWCPSGPDAWAWATTLSEDEQRAAGGNVPAIVVEDEDEDEDEDVDGGEVMESPRDKEEQVSASMEEQALKLLAIEFPEAREEELLDKWAGGANEDGVFTGANPVQVCALRDGELLGFMKVLVTKYEVYVDEVLVASAGRRKGIALHLFAAVCNLFPDARRIRLQVIKTIGAVELYKALSFREWKAPKAARGHDRDFKGITTDDSSRMFMHAEVDEVLRNANDLLLVKPALDGRLWSQACFPIAGAKVNLVVNEPEEDETDAAATGAAQERQDAGREHQAAAGAVRTSPRLQGEQAQADDDTLEDDEEQAREQGDEGAKKVASSRWGCSIANSYQLINLGATYALEPEPQPHARDTRPSGLAAAQTGDSVVLPGSIAQRTGDKLTCDKASLRNAPKNFRGCTSVIHQRLCYGVRKGLGGLNVWRGFAVRHMARFAQSAKRCFPTGCWFGDDGAVNVRPAPRPAPCAPRPARHPP